jgi:hypothetical protein
LYSIEGLGSLIHIAAVVSQMGRSGLEVFKFSRLKKYLSESLDN